jgi:hypothetical protein
MDPVVISALIAQGLRIYADYTEQAAAGAHTPEQSKAIAEHLRAHIDAFQALIGNKAP